MELTFLGTGTSQGVPMIACPCGVCHSTDPRDRRLRTAALVKQGDLTIVIDAGPDFRTQMLAAGVERVDAILLTHEHKDHTGGLDDVRAFNYFGHRALDVYGTAHVLDAVRGDYAYVFEEHPYPGAPQIELHTISDKPFRVEVRQDGAVPEYMPRDLVSPVRRTNESVEIVPVFGLHSSVVVTGFRIGELAYLTDFNYIADEELEKIMGVEVLVVNALGHRSHPSHFNLEQAIEVSRRAGARRTYLTHISHRMGFYADEQPKLPENVFLGYDGLRVEV